MFTTSISNTIRSSFGLALVAFTANLATAGNPLVQQDAKYLPTDGVEFLNFGRVVDIENDVVAIGADNDNINGSSISSAYLFKLSTGTQRFKLDPGPGNAGKGFGRSIAVNGGFVAVGADIGPDTGSVFIFDTASGNLLREIQPANGASWDRFGYSVALDNGILAVGAIWDGPTDNGAVYLFDVETGEQIAKIVEPWPRFGWSVAMDSGVLVVGATKPASGSNGRVFLYDVDTQALFQTLSTNQGGLLVNFGHDVAIDNGVVVVGAWSADENKEDSGSAYIFDVNSGSLKYKLIPEDGRQGDLFGRSVAISNDIAMIGSPLHFTPDTNRGGAVYLYDALDGDPMGSFVADDGAAADRFGNAVASNNGTIVVGVFGDDDNGSGSGSAYIFTLECPADLDGDGSLNFFDISIFLSAFTSNDPSADMNDDGSWNFFDVSLYLAAFGAGCP